ncbi:LysR family transcriptional regulator [Pseudoalteromonas sp. MMG012]|uniref:LysR family transcriptional regulator n=1 Tax=Pseudoalteromonas sp. MMG012 TaxID=2822686 RepID=UPI001B3A4464|nr:LysR family transcriptional regulator [Pseudoalteromonas sp. MMG012]MBQ4850361.1 LysR family transcriptional regulator [Pseudoalteromonas sp. MMG012]
MHNISNIDLNLLKLFSVLYQTGSVSDTADVLNISQSACSHALTRLRQKLNNDLFIRIENKMEPTLFSENLAAKILPAMEILQLGLTPIEQFNPNADTTYVIAVTDYTAWCMQPLLEHIQRYHPNISIRLVSLEQRIPEEKLKSGKIDLACGFAHQAEPSQSISGVTWFADNYVTVMSTQHPLADQKSISLDDFIAYQHVLIAPWNEGRGVVDKALVKHRTIRKIALTTPYVLNAPYMLNNTSWLLTLPQHYARFVKKQLALKIYQPPVAVPNYNLKFYIHKTRLQDPKIMWFKNTLHTVFDHITEE